MYRSAQIFVALMGSYQIGFAQVDEHLNRGDLSESASASASPSRSIGELLRRDEARVKTIQLLERKRAILVSEGPNVNDGNVAQPTVQIKLTPKRDRIEPAPSK